MAFASRSNPYQPDATEPVAGPSNTASSYYAVHPTFNPSSAALASRPTVVPGALGNQVDPAPPQHPMVHARRFGASKRGKAPERRQRTGASAGMVFEGYVSFRPKISSDFVSYPDCTNIGNTAMSCYPATNTTCEFHLSLNMS